MIIHQRTSFFWAAFFLPFPLLSQAPQVAWRFDMQAPAFGQAAMNDIDQDGKPEIVFSTYMNDGKVYALNAEDGSLLWEFSTGSCNDAAPLILDVNLDGLPEVILASSCITKTYCLDGATGSLVWETPTGGTDSPPSSADVDNDGMPEILHGEFNGAVICINGEDGSISWEEMIDPSSSIQTSASILDVNNDGQLDFVVASWNFGNSNWVRAFRGDNRAQLWESTEPGDVIYHGGSFGDLDADGKPELAFGCYDNRVIVLNAEDGSTKWTYYYGDYAYVPSPVVMADVNNDQHYELIAAGWYKMKALSDSGTVVWNYNIPDYASCFRGVSVSDIDGDSTPEIVFGTSEGKVIALAGQTGSKLWILDLAADYGDTLDIDHAPVIGDFDQDGKLDSFVAGGFTAYPNISNDYGRGYAFTLGEGTGPTWPMFQHDLARSSRLPLDWATGIRGSGLAQPVVKAAPNPFRDELRIRVEISSPTQVTLELCDLYGRVLRSRGEFQAHPDKVYVWSGLDGLSPGFYLLKVTAESFPRSIGVICGR